MTEQERRDKVYHLAQMIYRDKMNKDNDVPNYNARMAVHHAVIFADNFKDNYKDE